MLEALKFVIGAVAKKEFVPALTHFTIECDHTTGQHCIRGYNGLLAISSPIPFDINCKPKAKQLFKAIANCTETVTLGVTPGGRLAIKSGPFRVYVDCIDDPTEFSAMPEGDTLPICGERMIEALKIAFPFIGDDASRPWSNGVLFKDYSAFATNNITAVECWLGAQIYEPFCIPRAAIVEMLRINEAPHHMQVTETSITLHYSNGRWIRSQLLPKDWPDLLKILNKPSNPVPLDTKLFEGLEVIRPFVDKMGSIHFPGDGTIKTHFEEREGASFEIEGFDHTGRYNIEMLRLLKDRALTIDWSAYPTPVLWFGDKIRGAIMGMRA